jgi:hypothetical protein
MKTYIGYMRARLEWTMLALLGLTPILITACSNPTSAPATSTTPYNYSAAAFFNTTALGDTVQQPFQCGFPVNFLKDKLGLTDTQVVEIQSLQDSLRLALKTQLDAMKAAGTLTRDSVRALRQQYQAALEAGLANILTADQLATLKTLAPPERPREDFGRGRGRGHGDFGRGHDNDSLKALAPEVRDSVMLLRLEADLTAVGQPLTADQITLIQNLQTTLRADSVSTPDQKRAQFEAQMQTILTPAQLAALPQPKFGEGDDRNHHMMGRHRH